MFVDNEFVDLMKMVLPHCPSNEELSADELFTEDVVYKKLCMLNASKSPGSDAVYSHLLKNCADLLAFPLTHTFWKSMVVAYQMTGNLLMLYPCTRREVN